MGLRKAGEPGLSSSPSSSTAAPCFFADFFGLRMVGTSSIVPSLERALTRTTARALAAACRTDALALSMTFQIVDLRESKSLPLSKYFVDACRTSRQKHALLWTNMALSFDALFLACFQTSLAICSSMLAPIPSTVKARALKIAPLRPAWPWACLIKRLRLEQTRLARLAALLPAAL